MSDKKALIKRKLIEVALPLEAINRESAWEKYIRHGHPSTLHLWWARRPLAASRAVLFAQMVDDPSSHPDRFPTEEEQAKERLRLFDLIERLVKWENIGDEALYRQAYDEISVCYEGNPPPVIDPFAGGGSIPLEAQRLGLRAHARDLNPVAVLINKSLIEIPPLWAGKPPVFPGVAESRLGGWPQTSGLAEDVRQYGQWIRDEAERRIGHHYPSVDLPDGTQANPIAFVWARTITCPNPACGIAMPLARTFWLSKKKERPTFVRPKVFGMETIFEIATGDAGPSIDGTVGRDGAMCIGCKTPVPLKYVRSEGKAGRMGQQLMAIVAEGQRKRHYVPATKIHLYAASVARPVGITEAELPEKALGFRVQAYGITHWTDLFTNRQLYTLQTFSELVKEAHEQITADACKLGLSDKEALRYARSVATYLAFAVSRVSDYLATTTTWANNPQMEILRNTFARQAIAMTWDFAEGNPLSESSGSFLNMIRAAAKVVDVLPTRGSGDALQVDAASGDYTGAVIATDPPYYDNIGYADLSDFFYIWLRHILGSWYPDLTATVLTPKTAELIATPFRFDGSKKRADEHFERGFVRVFTRAREACDDRTPTTIFYAFKQTEQQDSGAASTGWETMLNGLIEAGLTVTATWPVRTERAARSVGIGTNALASSVVLACRPRPSNAPTITRRSFLAALRAELPDALGKLQQGSIAPVDLAQATIGPGMAVFSRYSKVVESDGSAMTVRAALAEINRALDEVLAEQEGDFDTDTRFCVKWFTQYGWDETLSGTADTLSRAVNTSVDGLVRGGVFWQRAGKARLIEPGELAARWDPTTDSRISIWEVVLRLAKALNEKGSEEAARLMAAAGQRVDLDAVKELAYLLFSICEKRKWTQTALLFNGLGTSWSDLSAAVRTGGALTPPPSQGELDFASIEE